MRKRLPVVCLLALVALAGCSLLFPAQGTSAGAAGPDAAAPDAGTLPPTAADTTPATGADTAATADVDTDSQGDVAVDAGGTDAGCSYVCNADCVCLQDGNGCDVPLCAPQSCAEVATQLAKWLPKARPCAGTCQTLEYPICGSIGCFQVPVGPGPAVAVVEAIAQAAGKLGCPQFHCGCSVPQPAFCFAGQCSFCPPDCGGTCAELGAALVQEAGAAGYCGKDSDCATFTTDICGVPGLGCNAIAIQKSAKLTGLQALLASYAQQKCAKAVCDCAQPPPPKCVKNKCSFGS